MKKHQFKSSAVVPMAIATLAAMASVAHAQDVPDPNAIDDVASAVRAVRLSQSTYWPTTSMQKASPSRSLPLARAPWVEL
jgi:hypothetical protein